jgi:hypothetical protein
VRRPSPRLRSRPRHEIPRASLVLLWPLFRYDPWRQAWILRGIGENHGPVLTPDEGETVEEADSPRRSPQRPEKGASIGVDQRRIELLQTALSLTSGYGEVVGQADPSGPSTDRRELRFSPVGVRMQATALSVGVLVAAVLGFTISGATGHGHAFPTLNEHAFAGPIQVSFPSGWRRQSPQATGQLDLSDELVLSPGRRSGEMLLIGSTVTDDPSLLPQSLLGRLPGTPRAQLVTLGRTTFYRYLNLPLERDRRSTSVYALPTSRGTVLGVCLSRGSPGFSSSCERLLRTIKPSSPALAIGLSPSYALALGNVITKLNAARSSLGSQLSRTQDARGQATAEAGLAAAHAAAASALLRLNAGPASVANSAMVSALQSTGDAYGALASATAGIDAPGYNAARANLARASARLDSAVAQLRKLGYRVS